MTTTPVVLLAGELSAEALALLGEVEVRRWEPGEAALTAAVADADALLLAAPAQVDAAVLAAAPRLRVVGCTTAAAPGVDLAAATRAGVMVVDAPDAHSVSAAELTVALLLSVARRLEEARASMRAGEWRPASLVGRELYGKTVGILGLGRVGVLVAERLRAFGMQVIAYDPYVPAGRAAQHGVRLVDLDELMADADVVSVHLPRTADTTGLIGAEELASARPGLIVLNAAHGGMLDEVALYDALVEGRVAGAALDVFATEPPTDSPLLALDQVLATPHLGARTREAQERAALAVAGSVRQVLDGELVPEALNVHLGTVADLVRPGVPLTEMLGRVFTCLAGGLAQQVDIEVRGEITAYDVHVLQLAALTGILAGVTEEVTFVNAPLLAAEAGTEVRLLTDPESPDHRNLITLRGSTADGARVSVSGTLVGVLQRQRIVEIDGYDVDVEPTDHLAFFTYPDRPGMVGAVGQLLGEAGVNIAGMQVARDAEGGQALVAMSVDSAIPPPLLDRIGAAMQATSARTIDLDTRVDQ